MFSSTGPIILDLNGPELSREEQEILQHPLVNGVILFTRNYENTLQLKELCKNIRNTRKLPLLIAVDQEGGRVQRFQKEFTRIPPMGELGKLFETSPTDALKRAEEAGNCMAKELLAVGVDVSFAPVLDLNKELNNVVGDRAFHAQPAIVVQLAKAVMKGMHAAGMPATGKHFPGHGSVNLDSHLKLPIDEREFATIAAEDLIPFVELIRAGINAIMPAHILFPKVDNKPVGFSSIWLREILRKQLKFSGLIFSDDLNMQGANFAGSYIDRAEAALDAGCDRVLICNNRKGAIEIIDNLKYSLNIKQEIS